MKQKLLWFGLILWAIILLPTDILAQRSQTKCPPRAKAWKNKSSKSLAKFPELVKKERLDAKQNAREMRKQKEPPKLVKAPRPQQVKYREHPQTAKKESIHLKRSRDNYYVKERGNKRNKAQRMPVNKVASVDCPR